MTEDWTDDEGLSREETLRRFRALAPESTRGPHLPAGGQLVTAVKSYGGTTFNRVIGTGVTAVVVTGQQRVDA